MERGVIHISPGVGRTLRVLGEMVTYKTTSDQTGGAYSLFEVASQPGTGPPLHVQHREDEAFWVLSGEYEFLIEGRTTRTSAGSLIYIPRGNLHAHKNVGEEPGRMLGLARALLRGSRRADDAQSYTTGVRGGVRREGGREDRCPIWHRDDTACLCR